MAKRSAKSRQVAALKAAKTTKARRAGRKAADTKRIQSLIAKANKALGSMREVQGEIEEMLAVLEK